MRVASRLVRLSLEAAPPAAESHIETRRRPPCDFPPEYVRHELRGCHARSFSQDPLLVLAQANLDADPVPLRRREEVVYDLETRLDFLVSRGQVGEEVIVAKRVGLEKLQYTHQ